MAITALVAGPARAAPPGADAGDAKADAKPAAPALAFSGRLFLRQTSSRIDLSGAQWNHALAVASARLEADYRRGKALRLAMEIDFAGDQVRLKDAFVRLRPRRGLSVQAGHFKRPISALALESPWRLPMVERGLLNEDVAYLAGQYEVALPIARRAEGVQVQFRPDWPADPTLIVGAFRSRLVARPQADDPITVGEIAYDAYARLEIEPAGRLTLAGSLAYVGYLGEAAVDASLAHAPVGSLELALAHRHVRAWVEGFVGHTTVYDAGKARGSFAALRILVAPRLRVRCGWLERIEPFAKVSILDPTDAVADNRALEIGGGASFGFEHDWRLQLQVDHRLHDAAYPDAGNHLLGATIAYLQIGAKF
jgi:hypothetical protein